MKRYHIYLYGNILVGNVTPQLMAQCIHDYEQYEYPYMANLLRELCADAKARAMPDHPTVRPLVVGEVQALLWGKAIGATKATRKAFDCTSHKDRAGLFLHWGEKPLEIPQPTCPHCHKAL